MNNQKILSDLFNDLVDIEKDLYVLQTEKLKGEGVILKIKCQEIKFSFNKLSLYNTLRHYVYFVKTDNMQRTRWSYRYRTQPLGFRNSMDKLPLCLDETYEITLGLGKEILATYTGGIEENSLKSVEINPSKSFYDSLLKERQIWAKIKLVAPNEIRKNAEEDILNSRKYAAKEFSKFKNDFFNLSINRMRLQTIKNRLEVLGFKSDYKNEEEAKEGIRKIVNNLNASNFEFFSRDVLVIEQVMRNFSKEINNSRLTDEDKNRRRYRSKVLELTKSLEKGEWLVINEKIGVTIPVGRN